VETRIATISLTSEENCEIMYYLNKEGKKFAQRISNCEIRWHLFLKNGSRFTPTYLGIRSLSQLRSRHKILQRERFRHIRCPPNILGNFSE
jgi:hypothetical protein